LLTYLDLVIRVNGCISILKEFSARQVIDCPCGKQLQRKNLNKHKKSLTHLNKVKLKELFDYIDSLEFDEVEYGKMMIEEIMPDLDSSDESIDSNSSENEEGSVEARVVDDPGCGDSNSFSDSIECDESIIVEELQQFVNKDILELVLTEKRTTTYREDCDGDNWIYKSPGIYETVAT